MTKRNPKKHFRNGFTLVELLVVMSIISLLVGILLPALGMARESSRTNNCLANQHNIGLATAYYYNDFKGFYFPSNFEHDTSKSYYLSWHGWIGYTYLNVTLAGPNSVLSCPSIPPLELFNSAGPSGVSTADYYQRGEFSVGHVSYVMNTMSTSNWTTNVTTGGSISTSTSKSRGWTGTKASSTDTSKVPAKAETVNNISSRIFILDSRGTDYTPSSVSNGMADGVYRFGESDWSSNYSGSTPRQKVGKVHKDSTYNILYGDGHCENTKTTDPNRWVVFFD